LCAFTSRAESIGSSSEDEERDQHRHADGDAELLEELADDAA